MFLSSSQLAYLRALSIAVDRRDLARVKTLCPAVNWIAHFRAIQPDQDYNPYAAIPTLCDRFKRTPEEEASEERTQEWRSFSELALDALIGHGYRVLDDNSLLEMLTEEPELVSIVARAALKHGLRSQEGETMAHIATANIPFHHVMERALVEGADVNARDDRGNTPLHYVWQGGPGEAESAREWALSTQLLLARGADPTLENEEDVTAGALALEYLAAPELSSFADALKTGILEASARFADAATRATVRH